MAGVGGLPGRERKRWARWRAGALPELFERQSGRCAACGYPVDLGADGRGPDGPSVDHVVPLHDGGDLIPDDTTGVRLVHKRCNTARGNRTRAASARNGSARDQAAAVRQLVEKSRDADKLREKLIDGQVFSSDAVTCPKYPRDQRCRVCRHADGCGQHRPGDQRDD
jgi:hypothetical protein